MASGSTTSICSASTVSRGSTRASATRAGSPPGTKAEASRWRMASAKEAGIQSSAACGVPAQGLHAAQQDAHGQALAGFPAVEGIGVEGHQVRELGFAVGIVQHHGRREPPQQRRHGLARRGPRTRRSAGPRGSAGSAAVPCARGFTGEPQGQLPARRIQEPDHQGQVIGSPRLRRPFGPQALFVGRGWIELFHGQGDSARSRPHTGRWTTSRGVPAWLYQRWNWPRSRPEAVLPWRATKSSQVTAWPSCRWK